MFRLTSTYPIAQVEVVRVADLGASEHRGLAVLLLYYSIDMM
jgi:hypothetical protein